jgi:hypothetical protein
MSSFINLTLLLVIAISSILYAASKAGCVHLPPLPAVLLADRCLLRLQQVQSWDDASCDWL